MLRPVQATLLLAALAAPFAARGDDYPPPNFKVAFIGDQGLGPNAEAVLRLVKAESVQVLIHLGDFDYEDDPAAWEGQTVKVLGKEFLQLAVLGNHDEARWAGPGGYGALVKARMERMGVPYVGELGKRCAFKYKGIFFVFTTPGLEGTGHDAFIRQQMAGDASAWRISNWHVNQTKMQAGTKGNEAGWPVYEESRRAGAIIATAHEHSYFRTHLLSDFTNQVVASKDDVLKLEKGKSFAFVSGLAGSSIRAQAVRGDYVASVYTTDQGADYGALFATFHVDGDPRKAVFQFKDIRGRIADRFTVQSGVNPDPVAIRTGRDRLALDPARLGAAAGSHLQVTDLRGRRLETERHGAAGRTAVGTGRRNGVYLVSPGQGGKAMGKIVALE